VKITRTAYDMATSISCTYMNLVPDSVLRKCTCVDNSEGGGQGGVSVPVCGKVRSSGGK
jgi:hypothetical protein